MFKRKQDVDKHVSSILSRKRDEKERNAQGFQIARLYSDIKEYAVAKRFLSGFLQVRENAPQAHQLMGSINEALGQKEAAIESYKRALDLGGFGSLNRQLILKICELYYEIGTDVQRMEYWLEKCEVHFPKSDIVYRMKTKISSSNGNSEGPEMESVITSQMMVQPADVNLRMKLLNIYLDSERYDEAYEAAVAIDLTTAFADSLPWFEILLEVFQRYGKHFPEADLDTTFQKHYLHVLRNNAYLKIANRDVKECSQALESFDQQLKQGTLLPQGDEIWAAFLREMTGQLFFLAGLLLLKQAQSGSLSWQEVNHMSGACFLASRGVDPIDAQSPWFVSAPQKYNKFYNWWYQQSYDRLSQVGHMLQQLSQEDIVKWSKTVGQKTMTPTGQLGVYKALFLLRDVGSKGDNSYFYSAMEMVGVMELREPLSARQLIDVDRVASQVHLSKLSHLVWLCLQRYSSDMPAQPNYHFSLMENIQFSSKNMETGAGESLCQLDVLVFLVACVRCAASALDRNIYNYEEHSGRPKLLPPCLSKPLCTQSQEEWWLAAFKFCTNSVKDDFSRLRRVLVRGIETVRLIGSHGVSIPMMSHIARSVGAKVNSLKDSEYGCRCSIYELTAMEHRADFYWEKTKSALEKLQRNQNTPKPKNRLFEESDDFHMPPRLMEKNLADATFALALAAMRNGQYETAVEGFSTHRSPWAAFYSAQIYRTLGEQEESSDGEAKTSKKVEALYLKSRECLYKVLDHLGGDTTHELNNLVTRELDELESKTLAYDWGDDRDSFHTPRKSLTDLSNSNPAMHATNSPSNVTLSTPKQRISIASSRLTNGVEQTESITDADISVSSTSEMRPRPSPERLDCQIKSLSHSQTSLFKMVLDRNEELIIINGKMMEELRDNNSQLKNVLSENKGLMEELKTFLGDNRDMMKQIKKELSSVKSSLAAQAQIPPGSAMPHGPPAPPLFMPHMPQGQPPRGPYPGFPPQPPMMPPGYGYLLNSPVPPQLPPGATPQYRPSGLPGSKSSNVGKYRPSEDEDEEEEEDLSNAEDPSAMFGEYFDPDSSFTHYFTPEAQEWPIPTHTCLDGQPNLPMAPMPPRMTMPPPGYFASALRGQSLQYSQATSVVKPVTLGPGFFSTPTTSAAPGRPAPVVQAGIGVTPITTVSPGISMPSLTPALASGVPGKSPQSPALVAALAGHDNVTVGVNTAQTTKAPVFSLAGKVPSSTPSDSISNVGGVASVSSSTAVTQPQNVKDPGKVVMGGFTFSSTPIVLAGTEQQRIQAHAHKNAADPPKTDALKPFAGFSLTSSSFGSKSEPAATTSPVKTDPPAPHKTPSQVTKSPGLDDEVVEEYEPNVDFKPLVSLPELVEKKTGEESETEVFVERCRLFRFDLDNKQWKERGVGELKILKSNEELKFRIIMRRDQILKLCANHFLNADMRLTPMASSDRAWCYSAHDFSEEEIKMEQLAIKFKTADKAQLFKQTFEDCLSQLKDAPEIKPAGTNAASSPSKPSLPDKTVQAAAVTSSPLSAPSSKAAPTPAQSLSEMFKPKAGSWECDGCMVMNGVDVVKCPACGTLKPGVTAEEVPKEEPKSGLSLASLLSGSGGGTGFTFGSAESSSSVPMSGGFQFGGPLKLGSAAPPAAVPQEGFRFGGPPADATKSSSSGFMPKSAATTGTAGGFQFGQTAVAAHDAGGAGPFQPPIAFGAPQITASTGLPPAATVSKSSLNFSFGTPTTSTVSFATPQGNATTTGPATGGGGGFSFAPKPAAFPFASPAAKDSPDAQTAVKPESEQSKGLLAKLLSSDDSASDEILGQAPSKPAASFPSGFSFSMQPKVTAPFGTSTPVTSSSSSTSQGFQFSFNKSPPKSQVPVVPSSPEVDEHGMYINKEGDDCHIHFEPIVALPEKVEVKTGEEEENILFESRGKLYRFVSGEWKEKGVGVVKILEHKDTKKTRLLMRRDQVLKICCNHKIDSSLDLQPMARSEGKAWVWYAMDFSEGEGKVEQLALRFRNSDTAGLFKTVFEECQKKAADSPVKTPEAGAQGDVKIVKKELFAADSTTVEDTDDEVIFLKEEKPTAEEVAMARKYLLPDAFYLYKNRPPCPGCLGCTDGEMPVEQAKPSPKKFQEPSKEPVTFSSIVKDGIPSGFGAGVNLPNFASLTSDSDSQKVETAANTNSGFTFGSGADLDFSSLAVSSQTNVFAYKTDDAHPFKFAGAGQKLFGADDGDDGNDSGIVPSNDVHFEPVIPLPDLVEVKTGEEDWTPLFCHRAKLFKYDRDLSQWKERGIGEMKILRHNKSTMFRVLQRREQVLKVSCNHLISNEMELKPLATSETSWCWLATDYTDSQPSVEQFAVKFKAKETALEFKNIFEKCQEDLKNAELADQTQSTAQAQRLQVEEEEGNDDDDEYETDEEDEEKILFKKRITLNSLENGVWSKLGMGTLQVTYDEDLNGNSIVFHTDDGVKKCSHVICREHTITLNSKHRLCEWKPLDFSTDEPVRKHFVAMFSSGAAADEFAKIFTEGQRLAVDSELSENLSTEIDVPEIFSGGEPAH